MKKTLIFWFAAVTCAAWILVGCEQEAKTETNTVTKGAAADLEGLQALLDEPGVNPVKYKGTLEIGTETIVVPAGKTLVVEEGVTISTGSLIVVGTLTLGTGEVIDTTGTALVIGNQTVLDAVTPSSGTPITGKVASNAATAFTGANAAETVALVLTASGADLTQANVPTGKTLYVSDTLTLAAAPTLTSAGSIIVLGTVNVTAATLDISGIVDDTAGNGKLTLTTATLTNSVAAEVTLPTSATVGTVKPGTGKLTLAGGATTTIGLLALGTGTVDFNGATTALAIGNATGTGTAEFSDTSGYAAVTLLDGSLKIGTLKTASEGGVITLGTATFSASNDTITLPANTVLDGASKTVGLGGDLDLDEATLTLNENAVLDLKGNDLTVADTGITLTSGSVVSSVAGSVISSTGTGGIPLGSDTNKVTVTKAALTAGVITAAGAVPIANGDNITFVTAGTLVVAGTGKVTLPNTEFGAGTYTATGAVVINALDAGDTIVTEGGSDDQTSKLAIGNEISLGEATAASTDAITYTFKKSATDKIVVGAAADKITIPADAGETPASGSGANIAAGANGAIILGDGSIELERKVSGNGAGSLTLALGTNIGVFSATTSNYYVVQSGANVADADGEEAEKVTIGSANTSGTITGVVVNIYGATGAGTARPSGEAVYASIAKALSLADS